MLTLDGVLVTPGGWNAPTVRDIAISLGRTPRFAGQTRVWWSVLHHSLACLAYAAKENAMTQLAVLLHDAHEAVTGDITTHWKSPEMKAHQREIDARLWAMLGVVNPARDSTLVRYIQFVDQALLRGEGRVVGPPNIGELIGEPRLEAMEAVWYVQNKYKGGLSIFPESRIVSEFQHHVTRLVAAVG